VRQRILILFDIDATLVSTSRAGFFAMGDAGRELFGEHFVTDGVSFAGRLDPLIIHDLLTTNAVEPDEQNIGGMRQGYVRHLRGRLGVPGTAAALPGTRDLVRRVHTDTRFVTGLLTGNYPESGQLKLGACGFGIDDFEIKVWGSDSPHIPPDRTHLPPVAFMRFQAQLGQPVAPDQAVIIGDTPHDVACAKAHGCRSVAVATGMFSEQALRDAGADLVVGSLAATEDILSWLHGAGSARA